MQHRLPNSAFGKTDSTASPQGLAVGVPLSDALEAARTLMLTLLLTAAVLLGQTLGQQHFHADGEPAVDCVVCLQSDHTPLPKVAMATVVFVVAASDLVTPPVTALIPAVFPASYLSRAPPKA